MDLSSTVCNEIPEIANGYDHVTSHSLEPSGTCLALTKDIVKDVGTVCHVRLKTPTFQQTFWLITSVDNVCWNGGKSKCQEPKQSTVDGLGISRRHLI